MTKTNEILLTGKAKTLSASDVPNCLLMTFRDDISAFNGEKLEQIPGKGALNLKINTFLMHYLQQHGVDTHFVEQVDDTSCLVKKLNMLPIEAVMRNVAAGSFCKRFGVEKGALLKKPIFELYLKDDALGDPMVRDDHVYYFEWATREQVEAIKKMTFRVNASLSELFTKKGLTLVDFKLEFGEHDGQLLLADELSPDGMRVWDSSHQTVLDKDRFRQNLGDVMEGYQQLADKLGIT